MAVRTASEAAGRGRRRSPRRLILVLLLGGVLSAGGAVVAWPGARDVLVESGQDFRLTALEVKGLRLLDGDDILEASDLTVGDNIFHIDLNEVAARLNSLVWVKRARIERKPPDRLSITIVERERIAWLELGGRILGVDAEGVLLPEARLSREGREDLDLPVLRSGRPVSALNAPERQAQPGQSLADSALVPVLRWWEAAAALDAEFCRNVSEVRPLGDDAVRLFLVGDGLEVRMPMDRVQDRLAVLKELMGRVYRECPDPTYVDLRYEGQVVVGNRSSNRKEG